MWFRGFFFGAQTHQRMAAQEHVLRAPVCVQYLHFRHHKKLLCSGQKSIGVFRQ